MWKRSIVSAVAGVLLTAVAAAPGAADETPLGGDQIREALTGNKAVGMSGDPWSQTFDPGGHTLYIAGGSPSSGRWEVRGDRYCSLWPPSTAWDCYDMTGDLAADPPTVTWISPGGKTYPAEIVVR